MGLYRGGMTTERLLTAQQLADHLQVSYATVVNMANTGDVPAFKVGRAWRFSLEQVLSALSAPSQDPWALPPRRKAARRLLDTSVDTSGYDIA